MSHKLSSQTVQAIRDLHRSGRVQREISAVLGVSKGAVSNVIRSMYGRPVAARPSPQNAFRAQVAPTPPAVPTIDVRAAQRAALNAAWYAAETVAERADVDLAILRLDDRDLDAALERGEGVVMALAGSARGEIVTALGTAERIAALAAYVNDEDCDAATALLEGAIQILKGTP